MTPESVAAHVIRGLFAERNRRPMTAIEERAVAIAAALHVRPLRRNVWAVRSQSADREYRVTGDTCDCPFDGRCACKHAVAVGMFCELADELPRRLGRGGGWDGTTEDARGLLVAYAAMVSAAAGYRPPPDGLLTAFRLEAVGDDAWQAQRQAQRQARRRGTAYVPAKVRDVRPDRPWVAKVTGVCPRYEFARAFLSGRPDYRDADKYGSRGVYLYYELGEGLYEIYERLDHYRGKRYFARVADLALTEITKPEVLACLCPNRGAN